MNPGENPAVSGPQKHTILIIDDDPLICSQLEKEFQRNYFLTETAHSYSEAQRFFAGTDRRIELVILDVKLPDGDGLRLLEYIKNSSPATEVIVVTGYGTIDVAIQALRRGAVDYLEKPWEQEVFFAAIGRAIEKLQNIDREKPAGSTILLIDDDPLILEVLGEVLTEEGYLTLSATTGKGGLELVEQHKIDLILADIGIGDMNGIDVIRQAKLFYPDIEAIMVTGKKDERSAINSLRAGAMDYITKPVDIEELLFSIRKALDAIELRKSRRFRDREMKISREIIGKMNEELEQRIEERTKELSLMQGQLFQTSKLATLGEMSAGLAHEINQPLGGIALVAKTFRKLHERKRLTDEELLSGVADIEASVLRMTKIINHIRTFARQDTHKFIEVSIGETVESALTLLGEQLRLHGIAVIREYEEDCPVIEGEPFQLEQVWINLLSNARDAMDEKGRKDLAFEKQLTITIGPLVDENMVCVTFKDNGTGMKKETLARAMEPFFTTKEVGKSTGLGLSICYGIIQTHKGIIEIKAEEDVGCQVTVKLPIKSIRGTTHA